MPKGDFDFDVLVVGYGPSGQSLAALLSRLGHRVCVAERFPTLYGQPRLCTVDGEAARIIQAAGDVDYAFRSSSVCSRYDIENLDGNVLASINWGGSRTCGYPSRISFFQPDVEDSMDAKAREYGAEINQGWQFVGYEEDDDGLVVRLKERDLGYGERRTGEREVRVRYLVGCDGANSPVREAAGIDREDFGFRDAFLSVDAEVIGTLPKRLARGVAISVFDPGRTITFVPIGSNRMRFEFLVNPDDDHSAILLPEVGYDFLEKSWGLGRDQVRIYRQVIYQFSGKLANAWRKGRVFIAGDAAHLMPPFMGQGACSALRDAINLAWKLHFTLSGIADDRLLDTYETERSPHVRVHIEGSVMIGKIACERDLAIAAARDAVLLEKGMPPPPETPPLVGGVIRRAGSGEPSAMAGQLMDQGVVRFRDEVGRFDDLVGWGFQLIGYELDPADSLDESQRAFLDRIGCKIVRVTNDPAADGALDLNRVYESFFHEQDMMKAVLVRPDYYIFGAAWDAEDIGGLVDDLRAQLLVGAEAPVEVAA